MKTYEASVFELWTNDADDGHSLHEIQTYTSPTLEDLNKKLSAQFNLKLFEVDGNEYRASHEGLDGKVRFFVETIIAVYEVIRTEVKL